MTNTTFYTLEDVRIEATLWCAKIGLGSDTTPVDRCERGMQSSRHEPNKRTLTADEVRWTPFVRQPEPLVKV